jgi:G3E family GTPase
LLIESTGISEPLPVAETFTFADEEGISLGDVARLDTMVTVVDAGAFFNDFMSLDLLTDRNLAVSEYDERSIVDLLVDQIEFANVIIINKTDRVSQSDLQRLEAAIMRLNPRAEVIHATWGVVALNRILNTGLFDFDEAAQAPGWMQVLRGEEQPETEEYGISSFVYRAHRPFHPQRFWEYLNADWGHVLRSKGLFWLASRHDQVGIWSQAGGLGRTEPGGLWWASVPQSEWPDDLEERMAVLEVWQEPWGDRRQEIVVIGMDLDQAHITANLNACLLTDDEIAAGPEAWRHYPDPFGDWLDMSDTDTEEDVNG